MITMIALDLTTDEQRSRDDCEMRNLQRCNAFDAAVGTAASIAILRFVSLCLSGVWFTLLFKRRAQAVQMIAAFQRASRLSWFSAIPPLGAIECLSTRLLCQHELMEFRHVRLFSRNVSEQARTRGRGI